MNEEGRVVADPNILTDLLYGAPTNRRDIKVCLDDTHVKSRACCMKPHFGGVEFAEELHMHVHNA